jgi:hypothetical protein
LLLNIPSIKESIDIESRKFKISNVSLDISNIEYEGKRFTDILSDTSLMNWLVSIQFVSPTANIFSTIYPVTNDTGPWHGHSFYTAHSGNHNGTYIGNTYYEAGQSYGYSDTEINQRNVKLTQMVYQGVIRRISHDDTKVSVELEDLTEQKAHKNLPSETGEDYFKSTIKVFPIVYGDVEKSPTLITETSSGFDFNFGEIDPSLLFDNGEHIGYKLGEDIRINADYKDIKGYPAFQYNNGSHNPLFLYEDGQYHRILENAEGALIYDEGNVNLYQVSSQYETSEGYTDNHIDLISRFDNLSEDPTESNLKNLPSAGIVQCYKKQKFIQWNINSPYQQAGFQSPADGFNLSPQAPSGDSNALTISGEIDTNLDFSDLGNMYFDNCLIKFRIQSVPSVNNSLIYTYFHPTLTTYLSAVTTSGFQIVFRALNDKGVEVYGETINVGASDISGTGAYEKQVDTDFSFDRKFESASNLFTFEWSVVATYLTEGQAVNLFADIDDFYISNLYNLNFVNKDFYVDVKGRIQTYDDHPDHDGIEQYDDDLIENPIDIIYDLVRSELGHDAIDEAEYKEAKDAHLDWKFGFTINKKINSKKLIEDIAKSTKCFPKFKNDGTFGFNTIKNSYTVSNIVNDVEKGDYNTATEIKESEVISYSFKKTKPEQIYQKVDVQYNKDYAQDSYLKRTDVIDVSPVFTPPWVAIGDYYGLGDTKPYLEFESDYIRDIGTANNLREFLSKQYMHNHLIFNLKLPLQYINLEIGDLVKFRDLFQDVKAYGIDYRLISGLGEPNVFPGMVGDYYQYAYPLFMITSTTKNLDSVSIECMQLHHLDLVGTQSIDESWFVGTGENDTEGTFYFPDAEPLVLEPYEPVEEPFEGESWVIPAFSFELGWSNDSFIEFLYSWGGSPENSNYIFDWTVDEGLVNLFNTPNEVGNPRRVRIELEGSDLYANYEIVGGVNPIITNDNNADSSLNLHFLGQSYTGEDPIRWEVFGNSNNLIITEISFESTMLMGDVNLDGTLNVLDIVGLVGWILGTGEIQGEYNADANEDGNVNILDIVKVVNCILGTGSCDFG